MPSITRVKIDLEMVEGASFTREYRWKSGEPEEPVDLTGFTGRMQVRKKIEDAAALFDLSTANGKLIIPDQSDPDQRGRYGQKIDTAEMTGVCTDHRAIAGVYDMFLNDGAGVTRLQHYGSVTIHPAVTRG